MMNASEWRYRAEGGANVILSYEGSAHDSHQGSETMAAGGGSGLAHHVLRVAKIPRSRTTGGASPEEMVAFLRHTMAPLLGDLYLPDMQCVPVSRVFLEQIQAQLDALSDRPPSRCGDRVDMTRRSALLIRDAAVLPAPVGDHLPSGTECRRPGHSTLAVEIKAKWGSLPDPRSHAALSDPVKSQVCRYCMHQHLKRSQGKVATISRYCPLDLFSSQRARVMKALVALTEVPQNNFRLYVDGRLAFPARHAVTGEACQVEHRDRHGHTSSSADVGSSRHVTRRNRAGLEHALRQARRPEAEAGAGQPRPLSEDFLSVLVAILLQETVLEDLLKVQRLDTIDIEGIWERLSTLGEDPAGVEEALSADGDLAAVVRSFLLATSAKDCSLMIALRPTGRTADAGALPRQDRAQRDDRPGRLSGQDGNEYEYTVSVVDLDPKPVKKLRRYLELDREIVQHFVQTVPSYTGCQQDET